MERINKTITDLQGSIKVKMGISDNMTLKYAVGENFKYLFIPLNPVVPFLEITFQAIMV